MAFCPDWYFFLRDICGGSGFLLALDDLGERLDNSFPACTFIFYVEISSHASVSQFRPGLVHGGLASWDDCSQAFHYTNMSTAYHKLWEVSVPRLILNLGYPVPIHFELPPSSSSPIKIFHAMTDSTVHKYVNRHTRPHIKWSFLILIYQQPKTDTKASSWGEVISMVPVILPKEGSIFFFIREKWF